MSTETKTQGNPTEDYGYSWDQFQKEHGHELEAGKERRRPLKALRNLARKALEAVVRGLPQAPAEKKREPITMDHVMHGLDVQGDHPEEIKGYAPDGIYDNSDPNVIGSQAYFRERDEAAVAGLTNTGNIIGLDDHALPNRRATARAAWEHPRDNGGVITAPRPDVYEIPRSSDEK